jgi:hypothetical protein
MQRKSNLKNYSSVCDWASKTWDEIVPEGTILQMARDPKMFSLKTMQTISCDSYIPSTQYVFKESIQKWRGTLSVASSWLILTSVVITVSLPLPLQTCQRNSNNYITLDYTAINYNPSTGWLFRWHFWMIYSLDILNIPSHYKPLLFDKHILHPWYWHNNLTMAAGGATGLGFLALSCNLRTNLLRTKTFKFTLL